MLTARFNQEGHLETLAIDHCAATFVVRIDADLTMLIAFSGLPGAGKTTLARTLAHRLQASYVCIDSIEEVMLAEGGASFVSRGSGYCVGYAVAADNLELGRIVVADAVNPIRTTRQAWRDVAIRVGVELANEVVVCSDTTQHQSRVEARPMETRTSDWADLRLPNGL